MLLRRLVDERVYKTTFLNNSWVGDNMSGIILMDIRDNIIKSQPPTNPAAASTSPNTNNGSDLNIIDLGIGCIFGIVVNHYQKLNHY